MSTFFLYLPRSLCMRACLVGDLYLEIRCLGLIKMFVRIQNSFVCDSSGAAKKLLNMRVPYRKVVDSKGKFRFACDFKLQEIHTKTGEKRWSKAKKIYAMANHIPTRTFLQEAKTIYEIVPAKHHCRLYADLDIKCEYFQNLPPIEAIAEMYIEELTYHFETLFQVKLLRKNWTLAFSMHQNRKRSCHLVCTQVNFQNTEDAQELY